MEGWWWGGGGLWGEWGGFWGSEEGVAPLAQAAGAVPALLGVGPAGVAQPFPEQLLVLLQHQELSEHHVGLGGDTR